MRTALAMIFAVHGLAHVPGFLVPWRIVGSPDPVHALKILDGAVDLGPVGMRALGAFWLIAMVGFVAAGIATFRGDPGWPTLALGVTTLSLVLTMLGWPLSRAGAALNLLLLAFLVLGSGQGWLPS